VPGVQSRFVSLTLPWLAFEQRLGLRSGMALIAVARKRRESAVTAAWTVNETDLDGPLVPAGVEAVAGR
jgi:hypothetical protein